VLGFLHAAIHFLNRLPQLRPAPLVRGRLELPLELRPRKPQRFERAHLLRVANGLAGLRLPALALQFLHPLLDSRIGINQSLARISHEAPVRI
jgi:hypothetical protein